MSIKIIDHIPTVQYGFITVEADSWAELNAALADPQRDIAVKHSIDIEDTAHDIRTLSKGVGPVTVVAPTVVETAAPPASPSPQVSAPTAAPVPSPGAGAAPPPQEAAGEDRYCKHGLMETRRLKSKFNDGTYPAWFCSLPKGHPEACKAQFK